MKVVIIIMVGLGAWIPIPVSIKQRCIPPEVFPCLEGPPNTVSQSVQPKIRGTVETEPQCGGFHLVQIAAVKVIGCPYEVVITCLTKPVSFGFD